MGIAGKGGAGLIKALLKLLRGRRVPTSPPPLPPLRPIGGLSRELQPPGPVFPRRTPPNPPSGSTLEEILESAQRGVQSRKPKTALLGKGRSGRTRRRKPKK